MNSRRIQIVFSQFRPLDSIFKKFVTALFIVGALSVSFGQGTDQHKEFEKELDLAAKTHKKNSEGFFENLKLLETKFKSHLSINCGDKAELLRNFGRHFEKYPDRVLAIEYYLGKALPAAYSCDQHDYEVITQLYNNLWINYRRIGNRAGVELSVENLEKLINEGKYGSEKHLAKLRINLGIHYKDIGKYDISEAYYRKSIAQNESLGVEGEKYLRPHLRLGNLLVHIDKYEDGIRQMRFVQKEAKRLSLDDESKYSFNPSSAIESAYFDMEKFDLAMKEVDLLVALCDERKDLDEGYKSKLFEALANKAVIHNAINDYQKAADILQEILSVENDNKERRLSAMQTYAESLSGLGKNQEVEKQLLNLINLITGLNLQKLTDLDPSLVERDSLGELRLYFRPVCTSLITNSIETNHPEEDILKFIDQVDQVFFNNLRSLNGYTEKVEHALEYHDFCTASLNYIFAKEIHKRKPELATYYTTVGKSLNLYEEIAKRKSIPEQLKEEYELLLIEKANALSAFEFAKKKEDLVAINSTASHQFDVLGKVEDFNEKLLEYELDVNPRLGKDEIINRIRSQLGKDEAVVEFFFGKDMIFSYFVSNNEVHFHSDSISNLLEGNFIDPIINSDSEASQKFINSLSEYFKPFLSDEILSLKKLTIIPDGKLLYFPFDLLEYDGQSLLERMPLNYQPSFQLQQYNSEKKSKASKDYVGFAMSYDTGLLGKIADSDEYTIVFDGDVRLAQLPNAVEEVKASATLFDSEIYLDEECTRSNFEKFASDSKIVHIANHSILNEKNSNLSSIIFAKDGEPDLINVLDVSPLDLKADLAILSSCNSGRGNVLNGNGIRSLGQSFAHAGCPSVMVNLWEANDRSSRIIISKFNEYLKKGLTKSSALRKAKLEYIESSSFRQKGPKFWANIVVIGNDDPIFTKFDYKWPAIALGGIVLLGLGLFMKKKRA